MSVDAHTLVGAYVLNAVDDHERAVFGRHLRGCGSCRREVAVLSAAAARLADAVQAVPPPRLRASVLAAIRRGDRHSPMRRLRTALLRRLARARRG